MPLIGDILCHKIEILTIKVKMGWSCVVNLIVYLYNNIMLMHFAFPHERKSFDQSFVLSLNYCLLTK